MPNVLPDHVQDEIRARLSRGQSRRSIARELGIAKATVAHYAHYRIIGTDLHGRPVYARLCDSRVSD